MLPVLPLPTPPGRRLAHRLLGALLLAGAGAMALPAGAAIASSARSAPAALVRAPAAVRLVAAAQPVLRSGSHGSAVVQLQRRLGALHYDVGPVDGDFGSQTLHAVVAFQKVNGLARDGVVGPRTWAALAHPRTPRPRRRLSVTSVEVNLTTQVVYLARQGAVVRIYDASSGRASTPTPTGNFSVVRRINGWRQSPLGLLWRPNYFFRGFAVHGSRSVPAFPASHGCVRVSIESMNRLWSIMRIGMPVSLYR
jgi:N-acetylmuramoyl-L-alanine amidase